MIVDSIRQAVELARAGNPKSSTMARPETDSSQIRSARLDAKHLESTRIVAHDPNIKNGIFYDMLRTQVLHEMDANSWQFLAITSATAACGKSVTACNLALSIARLAERSVLLVDLDLQKPKVAEYLGLDGDQGVLSVLEGHA